MRTSCRQHTNATSTTSTQEFPRALGAGAAPASSWLAAKRSCSPPVSRNVRDIAIVLSSDDIQHDFTIDELDAHVAADASDSAEGGFTADETGTYTFYCSVEGHREAGMEGTLTVS
jgi:nitrite reductase (NO-forming)